MVHLSLMREDEFSKMFHAEKESDVDLAHRLIFWVYSVVPLLLLLFDKRFHVQAIVAGYGWAFAPLLVKGSVSVYFYAGVICASVVMMMHTRRAGRQMWNGRLFPHMSRGFLPSLISVLLVAVLFVDTFLVNEAATPVDDLLAGNIEPGTPCECKLRGLALFADDDFIQTMSAFMTYNGVPIPFSNETGLFGFPEVHVNLTFSMEVKEPQPKTTMKLHSLPVHVRQARDGFDEGPEASCSTLSSEEDFRKCRLKRCKTDVDASCFAGVNMAVDTKDGSIFSVPEERLHFTAAAGQNEVVISDAFALNFTSCSCYSWRITQLTLVDVVQKLPEIGSAGIIVMVAARLTEMIIASVLERWRGFPLFFTPSSCPETVSQYLLAQQHGCKCTRNFVSTMRPALLFMPGVFVSCLSPLYPSTSNILNCACSLVVVFMCCFTFAYSLEGPFVMTEKLFFEAEDTFTYKGKMLKLSLADWLSLSQFQKATLIMNYCAAVARGQETGSEVRLRQTTHFDQAVPQEKGDETWLRRICVEEGTIGNITDDGRVLGAFSVVFKGIKGEAVEVDGNLLEEHSEKWRDALKLLEQLAPPSDSSERDLLVRPC